MAVDHELVFDRYIGADATLEILQELLFMHLPTWATDLRISRSSRDQRRIAEARNASLREAFLDASAGHGPTYEAMVKASGKGRERVTGFEEVRGKDSTAAVYISIDEEPFARTGGKLTLRNRVNVQIRRKRIEGRPVVDFSSTFIRDACIATEPAWASCVDEGEYDEKVMSKGPRREAVGRDFSSYLPGLFPGNYFGSAYVDLIGRERLLTTPHARAEEVGSGVLVRLETDPKDWNTPERRAIDDTILEHLGRDLFFAQTEPPAAYRAPAWPIALPPPRP